MQNVLEVHNLAKVFKPTQKGGKPFIAVNKISFSLLNIIWLAASIWYFKRSFAHSKDLGLNRFN